MTTHIVIDGNNLLHAMHAHAPGRHVGRETLVRVLERWAQAHDHKVTVAFDGAVPRGDMAKQMSSKRMAILFSGPETADDVIIRLVRQAKTPASIRVVTSDSVIRHEAKYRRCTCTRSEDFVAELFPTTHSAPPSATHTEQDKPASPSSNETERWLDTFDVPRAPQPFDGFEAMDCDPPD